MGSIPTVPTNKMIKHIFFDADGMVVNKTYRFSEILERDHGITTETTGDFFKHEFILAELGKADLKEFLPKYLAKWGWQKSLNEFLEYWFKSENFVEARLVESIKTLRKAGIKCHLATNQEKYRCEYMKKQMGLDENLFDRVFSSCDIGYMKPSQEFWSEISSRLGLDKSEVLVWDDKQKMIDGAKDFGFNAELYTDFESYKTTLARYSQDFPSP